MKFAILTLLILFPFWGGYAQGSAFSFPAGLRVGEGPGSFDSKLTQRGGRLQANPVGALDNEYQRAKDDYLAILGKAGIRAFSGVNLGSRKADILGYFYRNQLYRVELLLDENLLISVQNNYNNVIKARAEYEEIRSEIADRYLGIKDELKYEHRGIGLGLPMSMWKFKGLGKIILTDMKDCIYVAYVYDPINNKVGEKGDGLDRGRKQKNISDF